MRGILAVLYRDYRQRMTVKGWTFWDLFVPIAYLMLFGLGFERALGDQFMVEGVPTDYATFFLAGVLAMTSFGIAMNTSWGIFMDKDSGICYEMLSYPITRRQLLIGRICFNMLLSALGCSLAILLGVFALGVRIRWELLPFTVLAIAVTTAGWFFFFAIFAVRLRRLDTFNIFTSACYIILMFISTMFYPIQQLPAWFRMGALINPMTWHVDILRFTTLGIPPAFSLGAEIVGFAVFTVVALTIAVRTIDQAA